jgi:hypothetical protein
MLVATLATLSLPEASAGAAVTSRTYPGTVRPTRTHVAAQPRAAVPYGAGKAFCNPWGGLSVDRTSIANVYPCSNPNTQDKWGTFQCADYTDRYEWSTFGLTAPVDGAEIVRYLHNHHHVPIQSTGKGNLPKPGDALSMWGAYTDPPGHTGVVDSVSVNSAGNGTIVYLDQNGSLSNGRSIGKDTVYVKNWVFSTHWSGYYAYNIFDWTLQANAFSNGTFIAYAGNVYRMVGGAPLYVSSWASVGGPHAYTTVTTAQFGALSQYPSNGTAVYEASGPAKGSGYVFAGGAPLTVTNWKNVGSPPITGVDPAALNTYASSGAYSHVRKYPLDGTAVYEASGSLRGSGYVFAGGAPLSVANWNNVGSPQITGVDPAALDHYAATGAYSHVAPVPTNGSFLRTKAGSTYRVAGGYAFPIASCSAIGGCPSPTLVDAWAIAHPGTSTHLSATPSNGTEVLAEPSGSYWTFHNGDRSTATASAAAVQVDDTSISSFPVK